MVIKVTKNMTDSERIAAENSNNQYLRTLTYAPVGMIIPFGGSVIPNSFLLCNGSVLSTTEYADLFNAIGYKYGGSGDAFRIPTFTSTQLNGMSVRFIIKTANGITEEERLELLANVDQTYDPTSENAQSGTAVAEAAFQRMPKPRAFNDGGYPRVVYIKGNTEAETPDGIMPDSAFALLKVDVGIIPKMGVAEECGGMISTRDSRGNLWTGEPVDDEDCVNKNYANQHFVPITKNAESYPYVYVQQDYEHDGTPSVLGADRTDGYMEAVSENGALPDGDLSEFGGFIARRKRSGNLLSGTPISKHDVANKQYVDDAISKLSGLKIKIVSELPLTGETDTLYFVPTTEEQDHNLYDEYIYTNGAWEKIGSAAVEVDLTDYVKNTDYATADIGGVVKDSTAFGLSIENGKLKGVSLTAEQYETRAVRVLVSKGTLDNVLAEKIGDIETALDELHNYAQAIIGGAE